MFTRSRTARRSARGFTLIELSISVAILALLFGAVGLFQVRSNDATKASMTRAELETRARRTIDRVAEELTGIGQSLAFPDPNTAFGAGTITYQRPTGVTGAGVVTWTAPSRLALELETGEVDNGLDDNQDGLVDERRLVLTRGLGTAGEQRVVLCHGVARWLAGEVPNMADDNGNGVIDEAGFSLRRIGDLLIIRLTLEQPAAESQVFTSTVETSILLRN